MSRKLLCESVTYVRNFVNEMTQKYFKFLLLLCK